MKIKLPDNSFRELPENSTALDLAKSISEGLARVAVAAKVNGLVRDLTAPLKEGDAVEILKFESKEGKEVFWHTSAHVMAQAVKSLFPDVKIAIGPSIDEGFYYDFDTSHAFTPEDFEKIEAKAREITAAKIPVARRELSRAEALDFFGKQGEIYKTELISELPEGETISVYTQGDFSDLCRGPHLPDTGRVKAFKVLSVAGAYWRGSEKNKMLQRLYAISFPDNKELKAHLALIEEAKKRDHRKIGQELKIYIFDDDVGPGLPLWLPNGGVMIEQLENLAKSSEEKGGYKRVRTPHLAKENLYKTSGHLPYYAESMFPPMVMDNEKYYLKAMNCPHHHKIFAALNTSYRDLPLRLAEYGTCYRYEKSGELFGLMRVRSMQMNDAHIYCSKEQFADEFRAVNDLYLQYFRIFGIEKYVMRFSTHSPDKLGKKYVDEPELWKQTETMVRNVLVESNIPFKEVADEAAFYGPKIDVQVWSAIGREFTLATNQVDFAVPSRFGLTFTNRDNQPETPICIHRAPLSTHERFIGFLIEHFAGDFPLWLSPQQAVVLPVSEKSLEYAEKILHALERGGIRARVDRRDEKIGYKIRDAENKKIPFMLVVGEQEAAEGLVAVRRRRLGDLGKRKPEELIIEMRMEVEEKRLPPAEVVAGEKQTK